MSLYIATLVLLLGLLVDLSCMGPVDASLRRHHRWSDYNVEESVPRQLSLRRLTAEQNHRWRSLDPWRRGDEMINEGLDKGARGAYAKDAYARDSYVRRKRQHNTIKNSDRWLLEVEVEKLMNDSPCNYRVEPIAPIKDVNGTLIVKDLKHIRCQHIGSRCQKGEPHCCIETYTNITIEYSSVSEQKKIYTGCICAHRKILTITSNPDY